MKVLKDTIKLRALLLVSTLGITWAITGNATTSVGITAIQQTTNFGIQYLWERSKTNVLGASQSNSFVQKNKNEQKEIPNKKKYYKGDYKVLEDGKLKWVKL